MPPFSHTQLHIPGAIHSGAPRLRPLLPPRPHFLISWVVFLLKPPRLASLPWFSGPQHAPHPAADWSLSSVSQDHSVSCLAHGKCPSPYSGRSDTANSADAAFFLLCRLTASPTSLLLTHCVPAPWPPGPSSSPRTVFQGEALAPAVPSPCRAASQLPYLESPTLCTPCLAKDRSQLDVSRQHLHHLICEISAVRLPTPGRYVRSARVLYVSWTPTFPAPSRGPGADLTLFQAC